MASKIDTKFAALIIQFFAGVAFNTMGSFLPLFINNEFNESLIDATYWTGVAQLISSTLMAITAPFWGYMCDRIGTKKVMMVVLVSCTVVYFGMAVSTNIFQLIFFRALQGSFGGLSTVMFSLVALIVPSKDLKLAISYQIAAMTLGGIFGPGIGGLLASTLGYRVAMASSGIVFLCITPIALTLKAPPPIKSQDDESSRGTTDLKAILPDAVILVLIYSCINFIFPAISWFLQSFGVPDDQLLLYTTVVTILNGTAFVLASPTLTKVVTSKTLPILSAAGAAVIFATAFVSDPVQFTVLRVAIGSIQSGIPPSLLGGESRRGSTMGLLNSARMLGMAVGPFLATSILGDGAAPKPLLMYMTMTVLALAATALIYVSHTRKDMRNSVKADSVDGRSLK